MLCGMDRTHADLVLYRSEARLAAKLTDQERTDQMRELFELYLAFQRTKDPEQLAREQRAEWLLNRGKTNPRYLALREAANRADRERHGG